ncbi:putative disease resistance RPP13-like protein 1 [Ananas comosus]|uniref:Disease resistance RPP13-like protein 1 n=1 Tax=Ananas comosus TaxID=4615 RepID=A0A6P5FNE4_ANACO|nr:putative disease resistance RPP13-like protein 1 [Ananas comosus]
MAGVEAAILAVLGWVASPLVAKLLNEGYLSLGINAEKKLEKMRDTVLPVLKSVIEKAEGSPHRSEVEGWLQRLKDAYDGAEDALDLLHYGRLGRQVAEARSGKRRSNPVPKIVRDTLSPKKFKLKRRLNKLEKIAGEAEKLRTLLGAQPDQTAAAAPDSMQAISEPPLTVFGRDKERDEIIRRLKMEPAAIREPGSSSGVPIIAIDGRPGVGKTTLAQYVRKQLKSELGDRQHFHPIMWVHASRNFNASEIMRDIVQLASPADVGNLSSPEALRQKMNEKLNAKKFLLVIDDVWFDGEDRKENRDGEDRKENRDGEDREENWDVLLRCLSTCCCLPGSKILVTSQTKITSQTEITSQTDDHRPRNITVAPNGASVEYVCHLEDLADNDFSDLFIHHALWQCDSHLREDLKEKCRTMAAKLNKDPTAAKMVGKTIAKKLASLQDNLHDNLHEYLHEYLETITDEDWSGGKTKALMWSFRHLPAHLKRCFSYCRLYPRGYKFKALELVRLWMAQGFIKLDDRNERMEDAGDLKDLVSRFYIQRHKRFCHSSGTGKLVCCYTLHELLYDLAEKVSRSDCVRIEGNCQSEIPSTIRHLCIPADKLNEKKEEICKLKKLRTLIVTKGQSVVSDKNVATSIFKSLKKLRVLQALGLNLEKLTSKFISEMKHLRILQVSSTGKFVLPKSVSTLYQLQVLGVENASSLPAHLTDLVGLRNAIFRTPFLTLVTNEDLQMSQEEKTSMKQVMSKRMPKWFLQQDRESSVNNEKGLMIMTKRMETWSIFLYQRPLVNNEKAMMNSKAATNDSSNEASSAEHNKSAPAANVDITAVWERWLEAHEGTMELIYSRQNEAKLLLPSTLTKLSLEGCSITDHALSRSEQ